MISKMKYPIRNLQLVELEKKMKCMELEMATARLAHTEHLARSEHESERLAIIEKELAALKVLSSISAVTPPLTYY